jgi:hypothetical protein
LVGKANKLHFQASIKDFIHLGGPPTNLTRNQGGIFLSWWGKFVAKLLLPANFLCLVGPGGCILFGSYWVATGNTLTVISFLFRIQLSS